jgi:NAD(P)-dependent dehydrogenase (short-subunit alcohol dehydrogenase family)
MSTPAPVFLITGAAGALGRAVAQRLGGDGARLVLLDRDAAVLTQLFPHAAFAEAVDITDEAAVEAGSTPWCTWLGASRWARRSMRSAAHPGSA